jgi:hypothetical protein
VGTWAPVSPPRPPDRARIVPAPNTNVSRTLRRAAGHLTSPEPSTDPKFPSPDRRDTPPECPRAASNGASAHARAGGRRCAAVTGRAMMSAARAPAGPRPGPPFGLSYAHARPQIPCDISFTPRRARRRPPGARRRAGDGGAAGARSGAPGARRRPAHPDVRPAAPLPQVERQEHRHLRVAGAAAGGRGRGGRGARERASVPGGRAARQTGGRPDLVVT